MLSNNNNKFSFWLWVTGQFPISLIIMCSVHDFIMREGSSISKDHRHRVMVPSARNRRGEKLHCQTESGETRLFPWMIHSRVQASFNRRAEQSTRSWAAPPATWASLFDGKASKRCFMSTQTCLQGGSLKEPYHETRLFRGTLPWKKVTPPRSFCVADTTTNKQVQKTRQLEGNSERSGFLKLVLWLLLDFLHHKSSWLLQKYLCRLFPEWGRSGAETTNIIFFYMWNGQIRASSKHFLRKKWKQNQ